jgi:DNA replication protein DnaC
MLLTIVVRPLRYGSRQAAIAKLDKFHLLILDDLAYVTKDQAETERRSLIVTANQPFGEWGRVCSTRRHRRRAP